MPRSSLPNIKSISRGSFEPIKKNAISLGDDDYLGKELKPIKIGGKDSMLELSETDFKINGNLQDLHLTEDFTISTLGNSITFDTAGGDINFQAGGNNYLTWDIFGVLTMHPALDKDDYVKFKVSNGGSLEIETHDDGGTIGRLNFEIMGMTTFTSAADGHFYFAQESHKATASDIADNHLRLEVVENTGATTFMTVDADGAAGHLTLQPDGDLILDPVSTKVIISATDQLYFDGGGDTAIYEGAADSLYFDVGGDRLLQMDEQGDNGNSVYFRESCAGFSRIEATFSNSDTGSGDPGVIGIIDSGGTDDTDIDFRFSNKFRLEMTGDITTINLIMPPFSANLVLVCTTNGDHDVTNWKAFLSDENALSTTDVMWAGGSVPTFTNSGIDIVSFYYDSDEQQCYGVASLAFATP